MDRTGIETQAGRESPPDIYQVRWARERMWRTRAQNNHEARERLRASSDPADRRALEILELNDAAMIAARAQESGQ